MLKVPFRHDRCRWDEYRAFHTYIGGGNSPIVLFDTGELICTVDAPAKHMRMNCAEAGVSLVTSNEVGNLWMPNGRLVEARVWLDDGGMQHFLHDWSSNIVVRLYRRFRGDGQRGLTPGIPERFQDRCSAYVPGPGLPPIGRKKISVSMPLRSAGYSPEEIEHIKMIETTGRAAMKLTNHPALDRGAPGQNGCDPDIMLKCKTWLDLSPEWLPALAHNGIGRRVLGFDYLLTKEP